MTKRLFTRCSIAFSALLALLLIAVVAASPAMADTSTSPIKVASGPCSAPQLTQPFLSWNDANWYTLAPGETADNFAGNGWTLTTGASITSARLADGHTGSVLDLPSGARAVSPAICVQADYPTARTMINTTPGAKVVVGVYYAANTTTKLQLSGVIQGTGSAWSLSDPFNVNAGAQPGWQLVRFIFDSTGAKGQAQIYNFQIDPRMKA